MQNEKTKLLLTIIKRLLHCSLIFTWTYYVCITIYNSTLFDIYPVVFPNGISESVKLPAELITDLSKPLEILSFALVFLCIICAVVEYLLQKNMVKGMMDICFIGIIATCIKLPQYFIVGYYPGNELTLKGIIGLAVIAIIVIVSLSILKKKKT